MHSYYIESIHTQLPSINNLYTKTIHKHLIHIDYL